MLPRSTMKLAIITGAAAITTATLTTAPGATAADQSNQPNPTIRVATFNAALNRDNAGELRRDLLSGKNKQAQNIAEIVQRTKPDVLLLQEFDREQGNPGLFSRNYLEQSQSGADPISYPYRYAAAVNTGVPTGKDLDEDGKIGGPGDAQGFGEFEGQYGMVMYSRYPIDTERVRTFQNFLWKDMPEPQMPTDPKTGKPWYTKSERDILRLSSKSHWDVPIKVGDKTLRILASHPTPPVFDGPEDRNGLRNSAEIRFWRDYIGRASNSEYIYDDKGRRGGIEPGAAFVVAGDLNADPFNGDSRPDAVTQLLDSVQINESVLPKSRGAEETARNQGGANRDHRGPAAADTADWAEPPGNLRVDYVLPSWNLLVRDAGVFWPVQKNPLSRLTGEYPFPSSDHRLVWTDVRVPNRD